ncbi:MAG: type II toxin-antitoxin system VapC family toxin [Rhodocyclaceae bacterium]
MFLIDTNVISEIRKGKNAHRGVLGFFKRNADEERMYLTVQTIGELRQGVERVRDRGDTVQAQQLERWLDSVLQDYSDRILDFDAESAQVWGRLMSPNNQHPIDKQIAAIALIHDLTVVTRNVADFDQTGVRIIDPFA